MSEKKRVEILKKLSILRRQYVDSLEVRLINLRDYWENLQLDWDSDTLEDFHREVHALAGSGATFGFTRLSTEARHLERMLFALIQSRTAPATSIQLQEIELRVKRLFLVIQDIRNNAEAFINALPGDLVVGDNSIGNGYISADNIDSRQDEAVLPLLLVEDDIHLARHLAEQLETFGYHAIIIENAKDIEDAFIQHNPIALIIDVILPEGQTAGPDAVRSLKQNRASELPIIFMSVRSDIEARLAAVMAGGDAYLTKPVDASLLVEWLDSLTHRIPREAYRILLVDDDRALSEHYALVMEGAGMHVQVCNEPLRVLDMLDEFAPDLVLMDVYMPIYQGNDLARVIRQMDAFMAVPIVYLSTEKSQDIQVQAMVEGGDDFLTKPVNPENLVRVVNYRAMRFRQLRSLMTLDSLTRLLNHSNLKERLKIEINRAQREKIPLAFAMIDVDHFKQVNDTYGHTVGDQVLKTVSRLLRQGVRNTDIIGRYGGEEFALILPHTHLDDAWRLCERLRELCGKISHYSHKGEFNITFSAGVAAYPAIPHSQDLIEVADQALYFSKRNGRNQVTKALE